ncbi:heterokaryon incompatibility protein-domain-containing protein [Cadophora sp. MPI-SDFR-AT-0126]|nr:heterokaryon incompatibility protein-domain-containing protein [Leotiomycetes sp. MPI-SDFR-AT-0126]
MEHSGSTAQSPRTTSLRLSSPLASQSSQQESLHESSAQRNICDAVPLNNQKREITLLKILAGQSLSPVRCDIFKAGLECRPSFDALSYSWSTHGVSVFIDVGGQDVRVSETLHQALAQLRHTSEDSIVWIDAICIDQTSTDEKNHQVPLMGDIYSSASTVVIWLGDSSVNLDLVILYIEQLETTWWRTRRRARRRTP